MVERPIKKSERQAKANTENNSENSDSTPSIESNSKSSSSSRDRSSGKRKKESSKNEAKQQINPALARGPKPVKAPVIVQPEPTETESERTPEDSQDEQS